MEAGKKQFSGKFLINFTGYRDDCSLAKKKLEKSLFARIKGHTEFLKTCVFF